MKMLMPIVSGVLIAAYSSAGFARALPAPNQAMLIEMPSWALASPQQGQAAESARRHLAQYCVPPDGDADPATIFCRSGPG